MADQPAVQPLADLADNRPVTGTTADGSPALIAARCAACGTISFPVRAVCPSCASPAPEQLPVGPGGTLYSYATVHVSASRPTPYTLGYVDLDEGVRVLATIEAPPERLGLDGRWRLVVEADGNWHFVPEEQ